MSLAKFESQVKQLAISQHAAYARFSDMRNLHVLKEKIHDPEFQQRISEELPADKLDEARQQLENVSFDADSVSIDSPVGNVTMRISEREEPKLVKLQSEGSPVPLTLWLQLLPTSDESCKLRVTIGAEVNMFMKGIVKGPLQQAADGLANILCLVR